MTAAPALPPPQPLADDVIELRLIRILGPDDAAQRPPEMRFIAAAPEYRFAIHLRDDGQRVGRIHLRITDDPVITRAIGHSGYEVDQAHRQRGYATRALRLIRELACQHGVSPLWILIEPDNLPSRKAVERVGFELVDIVSASPPAVALGLGPELCRYAVSCT